MNYCSSCGSGAMSVTFPSLDNIARQVCQNCQTIFYSNPKIITGAVVTHQNHFLLCKRDIEPQKGYWTYPAGFLENNETVEEGAKRETFEESEAEIDIKRLIGVYTLTSVNQIHLVYHGIMTSEHFATTPESSEAKLVSQKKIPWDNLAFPVIRWALKAYLNPDIAERVDARSTHLSLQESLIQDQ